MFIVYMGYSFYNDRNIYNIGFIRVLYIICITLIFCHRVIESLFMRKKFYLPLPQHVSTNTSTRAAGTH
ncbi:hypothetical protein RhiirA1_165544 [Rhizophagus irregularis]|uniref:Uncharacterized protein n=1 Tax=Rhizophagus irregularis TaxID=588596 RepID=A0A2N0SL99_9GLOM|nr:hypothetical protein RhiirA1_165544 [Rhizophagus irregularis]